MATLNSVRLTWLRFGMGDSPLLVHAIYFWIMSQTRNNYTRDLPPCISSLFLFLYETMTFGL